MMEERDRRTLQKLYKELVEVRYTCISTHLISNFVIDIEMHGEIDAKPTERKKMESLIQLLPSRGADAFSSLIEALRHNYPWLATKMQRGGEDLQNDVQNEVGLLNSSADLQDLAIDQHQRQVQRILVSSARVCNNWRALARNLSLKKSLINDILREMSFNGGVEYAITTILENWIDDCGKKATFSKLVNHLEVEEMNRTADELRELWEGLVGHKIHTKTVVSSSGVPPRIPPVTEIREHQIITPLVK